MSVVPSKGRKRRPFKKKVTTGRKNRSRKSSILLGVCLLIGILLYTSWGNIRQIWGMYWERAALEQQIADMEDENSELTRKVQYMETDEWVEQAARDELGLVKPGEIILIPAGSH